MASEVSLSLFSYKIFKLRWKYILYGELCNLEFGELGNNGERSLIR
jgi:hypothetical protein